MRILLYGSGWISQLFQELCKEDRTHGPGSSIIIQGTRISNMHDTYREVDSVKPDRVICMVGRTHGSSTIDYLELVDNIRDNLYAPIMLGHVCERLGIHMTYLGTGCIFTYGDNYERVFTETDAPNFMGSSYSIVKGFTDQMMNWYPVLNVRIRMPISSQPHPRNFITKIISYKKICSIPNSMSVLDDLLPILLDMVIHRKTGTINLTNPGKISHNEILEMYRDIVDPTFSWENFNEDEQREILGVDRGNNELCTRYPDVPNIHDGVKRCLHRMRKNM